jgi:serine phosphatase RsbU (regulator of sigma subunit)
MNPTSSSNERLALVARLAQDFNASLDVSDVLNRVMDEVIAATHAERGFVMLSSDTNELIVRVARGIGQETISAHDFQASRSVVESVVASGQPVLVGDAQSDQRFNAKASVIMLGLRSIVCAPLKFKGKTLGAIYVDSRIQSGIFNQDDLELMNAIAAIAAVALENARLYRETQARLETLDLLHRISEQITATLDLDRVLTASIEGVKDLLSASAASIITAEGDDLVFRVAIGEGASTVKPIRILQTQGIAGWVFTQKQPVVVNDAQNDPRFYDSLDKSSGFTTQSLAAVPLIVNENAIGVIEVFNKPGGFSQSNLELLKTFASSVAFAIDNARLYQVAVEKGRLERELQVARQVQASLIPQTTPQFDGWEFAARWFPAREVAGDYYDFIPLESETDSAPLQGLVIADVADKGMPSALFMTLVRSTLRASMYSAEEPAHGISHANALITADSTNAMFVTLFYGQLDPRTGALTYVNAGHNPPLLFRAGSDSPELLSRTGIAVGLTTDIPYQQRTLTLNAGDFIVLYTDGVPDALNPNEEEFGMDRLQAICRAHAGNTASEIVSALEAALVEFIGDTYPFDDITILVAKRSK